MFNSIQSVNNNHNNYGPKFGMAVRLGDAGDMVKSALKNEMIKEGDCPRAAEIVNDFMEKVSGQKKNKTDVFVSKCNSEHGYEIFVGKNRETAERVGGGGDIIRDISYAIDKAINMENIDDFIKTAIKDNKLTEMFEGKAKK